MIDIKDRINELADIIVCNVLENPSVAIMAAETLYNVVRCEAGFNNLIDNVKPKENESR